MGRQIGVGKESGIFTFELKITIFRCSRNVLSYCIATDIKLETVFGTSGDY